jgi:hypothetical protein
MVNFPMESVFAESGKDVHLNGFVIAAKNAGKTFLKGDYRTIKNTI